MEKLLNLVPQFWEAVETQIWGVDRVEIPTNFTESSMGLAVIDHQNPAIKVVLQGKEIPGCIVDGGSRVNLINKATCNRLGITEWELCLFWPPMADTCSVRPLGLVRKLQIVIGGHAFEIAVVVLALNAPSAYPILLGHPWLRSTSIKQNWQFNSIFFRRG